MNILKTKTFSVRFPDDSIGCLTLPHLLSTLAKGEDIILTHCRPHQRHSVHAFMVHIAAIAMHQEGVRKLPTGIKWWQKTLQEMTGGAGAWDLVQPSSEPAFMQPPTTVDVISDWQINFTPDEVDTLNTSANHSIKERCIGDARVEHWVYALIEAHAGSNSVNQHYMGASRVASTGRVYVGVSPGYNWGGRFVRDLRILLDERDNITHSKQFAPEGGHTLLWLVPFEKPLQIKDLDPFYLEVSRRVRLVFDSDWNRVVAYTWKNKRRLPHMEGVTGCLWSPLLLTERKDPESKAVKKVWGPPRLNSRSRSLQGFTYNIVHQILFGGDTLNPAARVCPGDGESPILVFFGIARKQGKTVGVHHRTLPIPPHIRDALTSEDPVKVDALGRMSIEYIKTVTAAKKALVSALNVLKKEGARRTYIIGENYIYSTWDDFETAIDKAYFERLFSGVPLEDWVKEVWATATSTLQEHLSLFPLPSYLRYEYRARVKKRFLSERYMARAKAEKGGENVVE